MRPHALVVEAFPPMRDALVALLRSQEFDVDVAGSCGEVRIEHPEYSVVVVDVPFDETAAEIELQLAGSLPSITNRVVLITADADVGAARFEVLTKPFERTSFLDAVRRARLTPQ